MAKPIAWTMAGSDSGGGAGIQADLHAFHALGVHGCSVITALTAQNSIAVQQIEFISPEMITAQINVLADDLPPRAIKLGMLGSVAALQAIVPALKTCSVPIICDPVLFATAGGALYQGEVRDYLIHELFPLATLLTPNLLEAEWLLGRSLYSDEDIVRGAQDLLSLGPKAVLLKGGHTRTTTQVAQDYYADHHDRYWLVSKRLPTMHTHGSGCTLSSAITACLALDYPMAEALMIAKAYVSEGIQTAEQLGQGPGPVAHHHWPKKEYLPQRAPRPHTVNY